MQWLSNAQKARAMASSSSARHLSAMAFMPGAGLAYAVAPNQAIRPISASPATLDEEENLAVRWQDLNIENSSQDAGLAAPSIANWMIRDIAESISGGGET